MTDEEAVKSAEAASHAGSALPDPNVNAKLPPLPKEVEGWLSTFAPGMFDNYQQVAGTWNHPLTQFSVVLVRDPVFRGSLSEIHSKFDKNAVFGYELGWVLLIWILRAWRLSKAGTWLTRIWVQAWVASIFWAGFLFFVPWLLWGKSYQMLVATVFRAMIHQFWT